MNKVNLIKRLFRHRQESESPSGSSIVWTGQSGKEYQYEVFPFETSFRPLPGNFIYASQSADGSWTPIYIAQTRDLHQRLEGHVKLEDAVAGGATHLHAHYCSEGQASRCSEERDLVLQWRPVCNDAME
jgi:hypothetical protein